MVWNTSKISGTKNGAEKENTEKLRGSYMQIYIGKYNTILRFLAKSYQALMEFAISLFIVLVP